MNDKKVKILHIITRLIVGGAQENTMFSVEGLIADGWETDLLSGPTYGPEGEIVGKIKSKGIPLYIEPSLHRNLNPVNDIKAFFRLIRFIKKGKYGIVHTHSSKAGILGRWAAFFAGVPVIVHTIHGLPFHEYQGAFANLLYIFSERITAPITTQTVSVSSNIIEKCLKKKIGKRKNYSVIRSGLNVEDFLRAVGEGPAVREKLGIAKDRMVIGILARLFHLKGHDYIIDAAPEIVAAHPEVVFLFIGDGILRSTFEEKIKKLGLEEHFVFAGLISPGDVARYIDACDLIVHPSLREGLPRVVPQSFILEKPVIAFDVDGTSEVVIPGKTGLLVAPKDTKDLKNKVIYGINNFKAMKNMAINGKNLVLECFTIGKMVEDIEKLYGRCLSVRQKG